MTRLSWCDRAWEWILTRLLLVVDKRLADPEFTGDRNLGVEIHNDLTKRIKLLRAGEDWWEDD